MRITRRDESPIYRNFLDCFTKTIRKEVKSTSAFTFLFSFLSRVSSPCTKGSALFSSEPFQCLQFLYLATRSVNNGKSHRMLTVLSGLLLKRRLNLFCGGISRAFLCSFTSSSQKQIYSTTQSYIFHETLACWSSQGDDSRRDSIQNSKLGFFFKLKRARKRTFEIDWGNRENIFLSVCSNVWLKVSQEFVIWLQSFDDPFQSYKRTRVISNDFI